MHQVWGCGHKRLGWVSLLQGLQRRGDGDWGLARVEESVPLPDPEEASQHFTAGCERGPASGKGCRGKHGPCTRESAALWCPAAPATHQASCAAGKGRTIECSIQTGYINAIRRARRFLYIENQVRTSKCLPLSGLA